MRHALTGALVVLLSAGLAVAGIVVESEPNDTLGTAQNIDGFFTLDFSADIGDSTGANTSLIYPHVTIMGTGNSTYDYYSFTVPLAGTLGIFDIDYAMPGFDPELAIWDPVALVALAENDDYGPSTVGAGGSVHSWDSFIQYTFASPGLYVVGVARFPAGAGSGGWGGNTVTGPYVLQVSLSNVSVVPEPSTLVLFGLGGLGLTGFAMKRRRARAAG